MPFPAGDESRIVARRPGPRTRGDAGRLAVMPRLFVATRLPPQVVALLAALERPPLPGVRWSTPRLESGLEDLATFALEDPGSA
jgi:hypothetical protein